MKFDIKYNVSYIKFNCKIISKLGKGTQTNASPVTLPTCKGK